MRLAVEKALGLAVGLVLVIANVSLAQADTVSIALSGDAITMNPADTNGNLDFSIEREMYNGLVGFDKDMKLMPELATSWTSNAQASEFTFDLRQGVSFQDGTPFNAQAVKTYFDWVRDPANHFKRYSLFSMIKQIDVLSPYKVHFILSKPFGAMMFNFAHPAARLVSPAAIQKYGAGVAQHPVGSGPFEFVSWKSGEAITLKAWSGYWGSKAAASTLKFLFVPNAATRVAMLQSGEVQFVDSLPPQLISSLKANPNFKVSATPSIYVRYLALNTQTKPFDNPLVRQAMNYAVNKEELLKVVEQGYGLPLSAPVAKQVQGYAAQTPYPYDLAKAKELLTKAGYPNGFTATVTMLNTTTYQTLGQVLQQMLGQVGIKLQLEPMEGGAFQSAVFQPLDKTKVQTVLIGWSPSTGDADWGLRPLFDKASWPPALFNLAFYNNPRVNNLIRDALTTANQGQRDRFYAQAQQIIWQDAPWVFLYSPYNIAGEASQLRGVFYMPDGTIDAQAASLGG